MEMKMEDWERKNIVNELTRGKDLARQLQMHLNNNNGPSSSSQLETQEYLVQKILISYEKALSMLNWTSSTTAGDQHHLPQPQRQPGRGVSELIMSESPPSLNESPRGEDSDRDQEHRDHASRKRKSLQRWTQKVQVNPGMGLEGPLDDGFSWRKYGQKDILGAKYPRGYYRCTHRNVQGCLATKQVQRSDEDPNIFEITYRGRHTCTQASHVPALIIASPDHQNHDQVPAIDQLPHDQLQQNDNNISIIMNQQQVTQQDHQYHDDDDDHVLSNFRSGLKVVTKGLDNRDNHQPSSSFHSHSANFGTNSTMIGEFSPPTFASPATSVNYFPVPQGAGNINNHDQFGLQQQQRFQHDSEIGEIIPAATTSSATNTPNTTAGHLDFPFGHHHDHGVGGDDQFDSNFMFDNLGFF